VLYDWRRNTTEHADAADRLALCAHQQLSAKTLGILLWPVSRPSHHRNNRMESFKITEGVAIYFLTFSVVEWLPVFTSEEPCLIITRSLNYCHREKNLRVNAFVIMPTHCHLIVFDSDFNVGRLQQTLQEMRKYTGRSMADYCDKVLPQAFKQTLNATRRTDRKRQFWQQSRHPVAIWSRNFWQTKIDYLHDNPRRKGLVWGSTDWRFSSAAHWLLDPPGDSEVILTAVEW